MIEWNLADAVCEGCMERSAVRIGELGSRVSILEGSRRNRRESNVSGFSLTSL